MFRHLMKIDNAVKTLYLLLAVLLLAAALSASASQPAPSTLDLRTLQAIHTASHAPDDRQMAQVLHHELASLYQIHLPIHEGLPAQHDRVILVGRAIVSEMGLIDSAEFDTVKWDGYVVKANSERIVIAGYAPQGTIYGTYAFLKRIGLSHYPWHFGGSVKRYTPVPDAKLSAFALAEKPFFELRDVFGQYDGGRFGTTIRKYALGELKWARELPALKDGGYMGWDHSAGYLAPIKTHIDSNPEYYPTFNGKTIPASTRTMQVGICACHPALEAITIDNALAWMAHEPDRRLFAVTDGDREGWHCPSCEATDPHPDYYTDRNLRWVNAVARAVRDPYPDNQVFTLAYLGTVKPPVETGLEPNALVFYAPWYWTSRETSSVGFDHPLNVIAMEELIAWTRLFPGQIGVYDYTGPWVYGAAERIKLYAQRGVRWVYMNNPQGNLLHWVASQLLWDPTLDVEDLIAEFISAFYGPAADAMHRYYAKRRDTMQQKSLTTFYSPALLQDQTFLEEGRLLLRLAAQRAEGTDILTETRILEGIAEQLSWVLHAEIAMQVETERLRSDVELLLQWHERMWSYCDQHDCTPHQWAMQTRAFATSLTRLGLPQVTIASKSKSDRAQALDEARQHINQWLRDHTAAKKTHQTASTPDRYELAFVGSGEVEQWQASASDAQHSIAIETRSLVGLHGDALSGVGALLPLSQLPLSKRGRVSVHSGHFRFRRDFEPALNARGQRYISLHLHASHAVPMTVYINERPAFQSDFQLVAGEQMIRIDWASFAPQKRDVNDVKGPEAIASITLDIWPQDRFYPYPETRDTALTLLGIRLESALPTPESLPYRKKAIWMSHFRPNVRHGAGVKRAAAGAALIPSQGERFRSSTPHRILSPIAAIVTEASDDPVYQDAVLSLQRHLLTAYGVELPVFWGAQPRASSPFGNAIFLGSKAALAHDRISLNDLDEIAGRGFVIRARHGAIAIAGRTGAETRRGVATYLARHGIGFLAKDVSPSLTITQKSPFLHELYIIETPQVSSTY